MMWLKRLAKAAAVCCALYMVIFVILAPASRIYRDGEVRSLRSQLDERDRLQPIEENNELPMVISCSVKTKDDGIRSRWQHLFCVSHERFGEFDILFGGGKEYKTALTLAEELFRADRQFESLTDGELVSLRHLVQSNADLISEIHDLTKVDMPTCRFRQFWEDDRYWLLKDIIVAELAVNVDEGAYDKVLQDCLAIVKIDTAYYPWFSYRFYFNLMPIMQKVLNSGIIEPEQWKKFCECLTAVRSHEVFVNNLSCLVDDILFCYEAPEECLPCSSLSWEMRRLIPIGFSLGGPLVDFHAGRFSQITSKLLAYSREPYYQVKSELDTILKVKITDQFLVTWRINQGYFYGYPLVRDFRDQAELEANIDLIRLAILLTLYRDEHHDYPATLTDIETEFGDKIPVCPFSGRPYQYEQLAEGFRLYYDWESESERYAIIWPGIEDGLPPVHVPTVGRAFRCFFGNESGTEKPK